MACSDQALNERTQKESHPSEAAKFVLSVDGYNLITTVEAALGAGVVLCCREGCYKDMASMQGSYRRVTETIPALRLIALACRDLEIPVADFYLDAPVSNSGLLARTIRAVADETNCRWRVELIKDPDRRLIESAELAVSADSRVLDGCRRWLNLARYIVDSYVPEAWVLRVA